MEISARIASNKASLKRSVLFIAFGAEEQGLLGSSFFVEHPVVPLSKIKLMVNMDMVRHRRNSEKMIYIGGVGFLSTRR